MNEFAKYHPLINFIYFTAVIVFSMIFVHPICLVTSLLCSVMYSIILNGKKALKFIAMLLPLMLISALINPAFNHEGVTVIAWNPYYTELSRQVWLQRSFVGFLVLIKL